MSGELAGTIITLFIAVQKVPCRFSCRPAIQEDSWLKALYDSTGQPPGAAIVNLIVFASGTGVPGMALYSFKSTRSGLRNREKERKEDGWACGIKHMKM